MSHPLLNRLLDLFEPKRNIPLGRKASHPTQAAHIQAHPKRGFRMLLASTPCAATQAALLGLAQQFLQDGHGLMVFDDAPQGGCAESSTLSRQQVSELARHHGRESDLLLAKQPEDMAKVKNGLSRQSIAHISAGQQFDAALIQLCQGLKLRHFGRGPQVLVLIPHSVMAYAGVQYELNHHGRKRGFSTVYVGPHFDHMDEANRPHLPMLLGGIEIKALTAQSLPQTARRLGFAPHAMQALAANEMLLQTGGQAEQRTVLLDHH